MKTFLKILLVIALVFSFSYAVFADEATPTDTTVASTSDAGTQTDATKTDAT